ncbi:PAS domain S-box protein [Trichormus sp. NMC-1]|uniref:PAS domain S-box protein n=1 Tax=Trichormus sp. NMC-1 TaxID=1853259 RepID=UPI0008DC2ACA|nr:PAS domain S-box protein [Trichormus sp. NMC-1]
MAISHYLILILENSSEDRLLYCNYLAQDIATTYDFIETETGAEALTQLEQTSPDLILLDYQLPDMDALEFLNQLRLQSGSIKIPVIMLTQQGDETIAVQAMKSGVQDYLIKSKLTSSGLHRAVHTTLEKTRLIEQIRMQEQQQQLLAGISLHIRQFLRLEEILSTAVQDVREFLKADRVMVSQFDSQMNGKIVAESVLPQWKTFLNCEIQDSCFRENQAIAYLNGKIQAISDIHHAGLKASYINILEQFQVKANLVVPILFNTEVTDQSASTYQLWGLLIVHQCSGTREWETNELGILQQLSVQMAVAIQQAELYQNLQNLNTSLEQKVQKRTKELQANERRFRAIFDNTFHLTGLLTTAGIVLEVNQTALNFGGQQLEDVINRPFWETYWWTISQSTQEKLTQAIALAAQGELFIRYEVDILGAGGQISTIDFSLRPLKDESEQIVMLIAEGRDISDKKRLERERQEALKALQASEAELRGLFNAMVDVILVIDKQGRYLKIAPTNPDKLYRPAEELLGKTLHEVFPHHLADQFVSIIEQTLTTQQFSECEYSLQIGNQEVWFGAKVSPISAETVIWAARDITAAKRNEIIRQQTERALQESQILLQFVMDSLPIAIFWKDRNCRYLGCNRQLLLDAGLSSAAEIIGKTDFDLVWREQAPLYQADDRIVMESGTPKFNIEQTFTKHGNIHRWLNTNKIPMQNADGEIIGVVASYEDMTERKLIKLALQESEQRYATLVTSAPVGIYRADTEGNCLYVNDRWCEIAGLTPEEAAGLGWSSGLHPEDRDMISAEWDRCTQTGGTFSLEYRFLRPDGVETWVFGQAVQEKNLDGKMTGYVGTITDISTRKQAEAALRRSEQLYRTLVDNFPNGAVVLFDHDLRYLLVGGLGLACAGLSKAEMEGKTIWEIFPAEIGERIGRNYRQALTGESAIEEILYRDRLYLDHNIPVRDQQGNVIAGMSMSQDITERKQTEQELQRTLNQLYHLNQDLENQVQERTQALLNSEKFLNSIIENIPNMIFVKDADELKFIRLNKAAENLLGYAREELIGKSDYDFFPEEADFFVSEDRKTLASQEIYEILEEEIHTKNRGIRILHTKKIAITDEHGQPKYLVGIAEDITERKQAEQIIKQQAEREHLLLQTTQRIRQYLDLSSIFNTATQEIRQLINADRVGIFKFAPHSNFNDGEFVSESVVGGFKSALKIKIHDHCFGEQYAAYYHLGKMHVVDDINNAGLTDCHRDVLAQFQIRANLVVTLLEGENLWGLLCIHQCSQPRDWQDFEIELVQQIANQLAIAIQQSTLYEQVQLELIIRKQAEEEILLQLQRLKIIQKITQQIRSKLNLKDILATITQHVQELMQVERVIVFRLFPDGKSQIVEEVVANGYVALKDLHWDDERWSQEILDCYWQGQPRIVPDVMNDIWTNCLVEYSLAGNIQSKIVAPILQEIGENETGRWVNAPNNKLWGVLVVHACSTKRIWEDGEAQLLQQIANQLAIAIQQADLFEQLQLSLVKEKEVSQMRARFITMASHEFRTPLAIISSSTGILQNFSDRLTTEKKHGHLEIIQKTIKHIVQLLDDVLMINRAEAERMEFNPEALDIIGFCRHLKDQIEGTSSKHTIEFFLNASEPILDDTLVVQFDPKILRQILTNLLSNAIKYSPENSFIYFSLTRDTDKLIFKIKDSGIGIPEEDKVNLFASFHRASNVSKISGTGLGLAIVKKCVDLHKGEITLDSQIDEGTTFTVSIPLQIPLK